MYFSDEIVKTKEVIVNRKPYENITNILKEEIFVKVSET